MFKCSCDFGYTWHAHSSGKQYRSACSRCNPKGAARESTLVLVLLFLPFLGMIALAVLST